MSRLQFLIALVVTAVWATVWLVGVWTHDYTGATALTPIMLALVTFIFSKEALRGFLERRNGNGKRNGDRKDPDDRT